MSNRYTHRLALASVAALLLVLAVPGWAGQVLVYSQAPNNQSLQASQNDTASGGFGAFATSYDNFSLGSGTTITQVTWVGGFYNPQSPGTITQWTVSFYANSGGQPGALLGSFTGPNNQSNQRSDNQGNPIFDYTENLSFAAAGGTDVLAFGCAGSIIPAAVGMDVRVGGRWCFLAELLRNRFAARNRSGVFAVHDAAGRYTGTR